MYIYFQMPVSFITVGLKNALSYPILCNAKDFTECIKNTILNVVSCHFILKNLYIFFLVLTN